MKVTAQTKPPKNFTNKTPVRKKGGEAVANGLVGLSVLNSWYSFAVEAAKKKHYEWLIIDQFVKGNQDIRFNPADNSLEIKKTSNRINFPINKVYTVLRAVRGFVTRHYPKVEVEPDMKSDASKEYARKANQLLRRDNLLNNFRKINKEWSYFGVKYGVGYRQVGYDKEKKVTQRWTIDPFDLLIGSKTQKMEEAPFIIKTVVRTREYVLDKFKDVTEVNTDNMIAASEYKRLSLELDFNNTKSDTGDKDKETVVLREFWYRVLEPNKNGGYINKTIATENQILSEEETPFTEYPFVSYEGSVEPDRVYPDGHLKHIISLQRMLNLLNTQMLEYNHLVNRGRFRTEKNSGFKVINTQEGMVITTNPGKTVQVLDPPRISPLLQWQTEYVERMLEDIGGQTDAIRGVAPFAGASGSAIERLQVAGTNDIADLRDNFEDALSREAALILKMYSLFEDDGITMEDGDGEGAVQFTAVGKEAYGRANKDIPERYYVEDGGNYNDVMAIFPENQVKVSVTSELGETKEARQDLLFKLLEAGLPFKVLLENFEFPNTSDVIERITEEAVGDTVLEQLKGNQTAPQVPGTGQPSPSGMSDEELAAKLQDLL